MDFFPEIEVSETQAEAIARGLLAVARADGQVHEREAALIKEFHASLTQSPAELGALDRQAAIEPVALAALLPRADLRALFTKTALLLAYADGDYGVGESRVVGEFSQALGVSAETLRELETQVKEYLLAQLSHLSNVEALAQVAQELDI